MTPPKKPSGKQMPPARKKVRRTLGGPELKMPSFRRPSFGAAIKVPPPVAAVVEDLRERGLLPVVLLLVAAIVAVPLLLSNGKQAADSQPAAADGAAGAGAGGRAVVLADQSGVRDYRKRLGGEAKDPFEQHFQPETGASGNDGSSTGVSEVGGTSSSSGASASSASTTQPPSSSYVTYTVDLYVGVAGSKLKRRSNLSGMVAFPSKDDSVAALIGVPNANPGRAQFLVADGVEVGGHFRCEFGGDGCDLLSLKPGDTAKFHDPSGRVYAIKLVRINPIVHKTLPAGKSK